MRVRSLRVGGGGTDAFRVRSIAAVATRSFAREMNAIGTRAVELGVGGHWQCGAGRQGGRVLGRLAVVTLRACITLIASQC